MGQKWLHLFAHIFLTYFWQSRRCDRLHKFDCYLCMIFWFYEIINLTLHTYLTEMKNPNNRLRRSRWLAMGVCCLLKLDYLVTSVHDETPIPNNGGAWPTILIHDLVENGYIWWRWRLRWPALLSSTRSALLTILSRASDVKATGIVIQWIWNNGKTLGWI